MKQRLGKKKHEMCEAISGRQYSSCWTRGGRTHGLAECWVTRSEHRSDADWVNYMTKEWEPYIRNGVVEVSDE